MISTLNLPNSEMKQIMITHKINYSLFIASNYLYMNLISDDDINILEKYDNYERDLILKHIFNGAHNYSVRALIRRNLLRYMIYNCSYTVAEWLTYKNTFKECHEKMSNLFMK